MTEYDNSGQVSLWPNSSDNPKAPAARGTVIAHRDIRKGEEIEISLWRNQSDNPKAPSMKGKISDKYKPDSAQQAPQSAAPQEAPSFDDDLPF